MTIQQMLMSTGIASQTYWTNTITNSTGSVNLMSHAFDSEGNIYFCGEVLKSPLNEGVIYKLDTNGSLSKSVQLQATGGLSFNAIVIDSSDDVYLYAGHGRIAKYNSNLDLQYFKKNIWGNGNQFDYGDSISNGNSMTISGTTLTVAGRSSTFGVYATFETTTGLIQSKYYAYLNSGTVNYQGGGIANGNIYLCGYDINPSYTNGNAYWVVSINGNSNTYRFYQSGTSGAARCIVRNSNGDYYIGGNMGGYPMLTKVVSYNETNISQGTQWWRRGNSPGPAYNDLALDSQGNVYGVAGSYNGASGWLNKIDPDGNLLWSREFTAGDSINKITIDSDDNIWLNINKNQNNNPGVSIIAKLTTDGYGTGYGTYNLGSYAHSSFSYALQDYGNIQYNWWNSTQNGAAIWGGLVSSDPSKTEVGITPSDNRYLIGDVSGQAQFTEVGTYSWTCPTGVYQISAVCIGGGGRGGIQEFSSSGGAGGGGGLGWKNYISVTPGQSYTVVVGGTSLDSYFITDATVKGGKGGNAEDSGTSTFTGGTGGSYVGDGGGNGGNGGTSNGSDGGGGGGAGGYSGNGGLGGVQNYNSGNGWDGSGGAGGGGSDGMYNGSFGPGGEGGGTGILGEGASGSGGISNVQSNGQDGSPGSGGVAKMFGGGGRGSYQSNPSNGGQGAVRLIWGRNRAYPSTNTGDVQPKEGEQEFTTPGTQSWTCPEGVFHVAVVAVGAGGAGSGYNAFAGSYEEGNGGGGGGLGYNNDIQVNPGTSYTVVVGTAGQVQTLPSSAGGSPTNANGDTYFISDTTVCGKCGENALPGTSNAAGGQYVGDGGSYGGSGGQGGSDCAGGGGAGGYVGDNNTQGGGDGGGNAVGGAGFGGGGAGGSSGFNQTNGGGGGGVGLQGQGTNGAATGWAIDSLVGQQEYTTPGTYNWTCPANITSVCVVCVGAGGSGMGSGGAGGFDGNAGGGLGWKNNITVIPGQSYTVVVGEPNNTNSASFDPSSGYSYYDGPGDSYFIGKTTVKGGSGWKNANTYGSYNTVGGDFVGDGGGNGGQGGSRWSYDPYGAGAGGGGGAGGYVGAGGTGGKGGSSYQLQSAPGGYGPQGGLGNPGQGGSGGGAGGAGKGSAGGGGVGIYGQGASGSGGTKYSYNGSNTSPMGGGGSGGNPGGNTNPNDPTGGDGGNYGGGAGSYGDGGPVGQSAGGAVRIIWGVGRAFPATRTEDEFTYYAGHGGGGSGGSGAGAGSGVTTSVVGGLYGGGSGGSSNNTSKSGLSDGVVGSNGGLRVIWGYNREFPNTNTTSGSTGQDDASPGQAEFTTPGTFTWTVPADVTKVAVVCVGGGGGGQASANSSNGVSACGGAGGGLGWKNDIYVTPGETYTVVVGAGGDGTTGGDGLPGSNPNKNGSDSYFINASTVKGGGGNCGDSYNTSVGGNYVGQGGGNGGKGNIGSGYAGGGGGGAGGYSGNGGDSVAPAPGTTGTPGNDGQGGAGGSGGGSVTGNYAAFDIAGAGSGGGGVGILGEGASGAGGAGGRTNTSYGTGNGGGGGSGGQQGGGVGLGYQGQRLGATYGGGGGGGGSQFSAPPYHAYNGADGGHGAVRIIWGSGREFPNTNTGDI